MKSGISALNRRRQYTGSTYSVTVLLVNHCTVQLGLPTLWGHLRYNFIHNLWVQLTPCCNQMFQIEESKLKTKIIKTCMYCHENEIWPLKSKLTSVILNSFIQNVCFATRLWPTGGFLTLFNMNDKKQKCKFCVKQSNSPYSFITIFSCTKTGFITFMTVGLFEKKFPQVWTEQSEHSHKSMNETINLNSSIQGKIVRLVYDITFTWYMSILIFWKWPASSDQLQVLSTIVKMLNSYVMLWFSLFSVQKQTNCRCLYFIHVQLKGWAMSDL